MERAFFILAVLLLTLLFIFKAEKSGFGGIFLITYTILITIFQLFRFCLALMADNVLNTIIKNGTPNYEPLVSIVVPCMNEEAAIANTLEQCFKADYPKNKLEIIVINDGSTDNTLSEIKKVLKSHPQLILINFKKNKGKREGMSAGFLRARGDIVVQLDSDSYIEPAKFKHLITPFANPAVGAVCAHADVQNASTNIITKMQSGYYYIAFRILKAAESSLQSVFCCSGCSSAYRKEVILPILDKFLNEKFMGVRVRHGDDRSLTSWVLQQGYHTIYTHKVQAYTIAPSTIRQLFKQQIRWKKSWISNGYFTLKYIFRVDPLVGILYVIPLLLISFLTPIVAFYNVYLLSILHLEFPMLYLLGGIIMTLLYITLAYRYADGKKKYIIYFFIWQLLSTFVFSYIIYYSLSKFRDQRWGTR